MSDVFTKAKRSAVMARIRAAGNRDTELRLIALMRAAGVTGWRRGARLRFAGPARGLEPRRRISPRSAQRSRSKTRRGNAGSDSVLTVPSVVIPAVIRRPSSVGGSPFTVKPDFVFRAERLAVFVDGCFWHGCPKHATWPRRNAAFWRAKIEGNIARDRRVDRALRTAGWRVLHLWEHALTPRLAARTLARLRRALAARARGVVWA